MLKEGGDLSFDELLQALSDIQRRRLLVELVRRDPQDDAPLVAGNQGGEVLEHAIAMRHAHLPKLADFGLIEWDIESGEVIEGPAFGEIQPLLELLLEHGHEWSDDWL